MQSEIRMQLLIFLHDHEDVSHRDLELEFDDKTTLDQLKEKIHSKWSIGKEEQQLFFSDERKIFGFDFDSTLPQIGFKHMDKVIVKHAFLPTWDALLKEAKAFKETFIEEHKKRIYDRAQDLSKQLNDTGFYLTYPKFIEKGENVEKLLFTYYDRTRGEIESSAKVYFENLYREANPKIKFDSRSEGSRRGCICLVETKDTTIKYYIKTHHGGGARDSHTREDLDLKELFAYKILQNLGVGPEIQFIPNEKGSRWILYIASREIPNFKTIEEIESSEVGDLSKYKKAVVQMLFLYTVLNMSDHHSGNMGVDRNGSPFIVDFFLIERRSLDLETDFYDKVRQAEKINKVLGTFHERLGTAKSYLKELDFVRKIDEMLDSFLNKNKQIFEISQLYFKHKEKTDDLMRYVQTIKENALKINEYPL